MNLFYKCSFVPFWASAAYRCKPSAPLPIKINLYHVHSILSPRGKLCTEWQPYTNKREKVIDKKFKLIQSKEKKIKINIMLKSIFFFGLFNLFIHLQFHYYNVSFTFK